MLTKYLSVDESQNISEGKRGNHSNLSTSISALNLSLKSNSSGSNSSSSNTSLALKNLNLSTGTVNTHVSNSSVEQTINPFNLKDLEEQDERELRRLEIQYELNNQGASDLVIDLFMSDISNKVFKESVLLGIALLEGGNTQVQKTMYNRLISDKSSEKFCKAFHDRIETAQKEIKNLNSFMSSDINDGSYLCSYFDFLLTNLNAQSFSKKLDPIHNSYAILLLIIFKNF